jgi:nitrate reductase NapE component
VQLEGLRLKRNSALIGSYRRRTKSGSAISEFGPALFLFLIFMLFPVIDVISMGFAYFAACTLNDLQLREAARQPKTQVLSIDGLVQETIPQKWRASNLSILIAPQTNITTAVNYKPGVGAVYLTLNTTVSFRPLLPIPFLNGIPGLGAPLTLTISGSRPLEDPILYAQ